jgi:hypothetical protein
MKSRPNLLNYPQTILKGPFSLATGLKPNIYPLFLDRDQEVLTSLYHNKNRAFGTTYIDII